MRPVQDCCCALNSFFGASKHMTSPQSLGVWPKCAISTKRFHRLVIVTVTKGEGFENPENFAVVICDFPLLLF